MTIVDFLRAEIDRDEANLRSYIGPWAPEPIQQRRLDDFVAKRRIIDLYTEAAERAAAELVPNDHEVRTAALGDVIQILTEAYDTRPGWQEEWRPMTEILIGAGVGACVSVRGQPVTKVRPPIAGQFAGWWR